MIPTNFNQTLHYHGVADSAGLLADLIALRKSSADIKSFRWILFYLFLLWLVSGVGVSYGLTSELTWWIVLVWGILSLIAYRIIDLSYAKLILDERRLKIAYGVMRAVACDMQPEEKAELTLNFNPYHHPPFLTESWPLPNYSAAAYCQTWLRIHARLADGTRLTLEADRVATRKERAKRKGKKLKESLCEHVRLALRPDSLPDHVESTWPAAVKRCPMPPNANVHRARVIKGRVELEIRTHSFVRVTDKGTVLSGHDVEDKLCSRDFLLMPMLAAYRALAQARAGKG